MRRRAWQGREIPLEPEVWPLLADAGGGPQAAAEQRELLAASQRGIDDALTRTSARCSSRWRSTTCRSTCWPSG